MDKNKIMNKSGFSLVEILIVVTIIIIFSGLTLASYNHYNQKKELEATAQKISDILELAKKKAITGGQTCSDILRGYQVKFLDATSYELDEVCTNEYSMQRFAINSYYSLTYSHSAIMFERLTGWLINDVDVTIKVKNSQTNQCVDISVSKYGQVNLGSVYTSGC